MREHYRMFARYNQWANRRLYAAAADLSESEYRADHGAFFGSIHGTLNHLLVTDRIWMQRMSGTGESYSRLDLILHEELSELRAARGAEDERIIGWVDTLDDDALSGTFSYMRVSSPEPVTQPLGPALAHLFNHHAHHRGQAHALITRIAGRSAGPELDLIFFQRESGLGMRA